MTDSERTLAAAAEAIVGALLSIGGVLLPRLNGFFVALGIALLTLGVIALAHAVVVGSGLVKLPDNGRGRGRGRDE